MSEAEKRAANQKKRQRKKANRTVNEKEKEKLRTKTLLQASRHRQKVRDNDLDTFRLNAHVIKKYPSSKEAFKKVNFSAHADLWHSKPGWMGAYVRPETIAKARLKSTAQRERIPVVKDHIWTREELEGPPYHCTYLDWDGV
jgi:hypothetical protein